MSSETPFDEMVTAVVHGDIARIAELLDRGLDVNSFNERGETAFSFACVENQLLVAKFLVSRGAEINSVDAGGGSPLDWAVCHSSPEFREWLIGIGGKRHDLSYEAWPWPPKGCS
jgi:ankyrin repeat protein